jgi:hypothetical protein
MLDKKIFQLYMIGGSKNVKKMTYSLREVLIIPKHILENKIFRFINPFQLRP